jgi:hypothetical protein
MEECTILCPPLMCRSEDLEHYPVIVEICKYISIGKKCIFIID